ncbi:LPXTG cell wall anchor domain-containing protein [Lactococcus garvieae]|uniref:LPXTG cell wall anchor domain-containing protein n=1 Tax=Lactococcus garvieae TaxID=1363 RepID=UPI001F6147C5|nr:LPXTG cell wall anchor domain-containing protein [Lactococcus garvieae]MCI3861346.1 LPXTG cell wall anchor domain-containing protein [Lactococcus garvieae]
MRKIRVILLALVISTLSVFPTTAKADRDDYSTVQVTGSLTPNESVIPEENGENNLEEKTTVIKKGKLPETGDKSTIITGLWGILSFVVLIVIVYHSKLRRFSDDL